MVRNRFSSGLVKKLSIVRCCPRLTPSEIIEYSKNLPFIWCPSLKTCVSRKTSNFMVDFMQLTPQLSTSVCLYLDGLNSEAPSLALKSTRRLISLPRYQYSTESPMRSSTMSTQWTGSLMSLTPAMSLTEVTLTWQDSMQSTSLWLFSSSVKNVDLNMKLWMGKNFSMERIMFFMIRPYDSQVRGISATIQVLSDVLSTLHQTCNEPLLTTQITSILLPRILPGFIATDGKLSYSSNGSSSIFVSKPSGESPRMLLESKSMWQSSRIALLESLRGGSTSIAQSFKSCEYSAVRCSSKRTSLNCSSTLKKRRSRPMDS